MDLISVIVPVYKVEQYLDKCVQSIVAQTYRNLEIILVDDGSPDNCGAMCDAWAGKDARIRVIHKDNGGSAQARNIGLDLAAGAYICFVDSDDYLLPDMLQSLLDLMISTQSDITECGHYIVDSDEITQFSTEPVSIHSYTTEQALRGNILDCVCRQLVWDKLYRRNVLRGVRFVEQKVIDDEFFTYRALAQANKITVTNRKLYCYREQSESIMHQQFSIKRLQALEAKEGRLEYIRVHYPTLLPDARQNLFQTCLYLGQMSLLHLNNADRNAAFEQFHSILARYPLTAEDLRSLPMKQRVWPMLARLSFPFTCKLRNFLRKGI